MKAQTAIILSLIGLTQVAKAAEKPNVLFILVDDMQMGAVRKLGDKTPGSAAINSLIDHSSFFNRCYTMGSIGGALSMPSRAMIMTGRTLFETTADGQVIPEKNITIPQTLRQNGYRTFATGKWHSDFKSFNRTFSEGENIFFGGMHQYNIGGHTVPRLQHYRPDGDYKGAPQFIGEKFSSAMYADAAIDFLTARAVDSDPFFCYVAFTSPHDPHNRIPWYSNPLDTTLCPLPENYAPSHPFDNGELGVRDETVVPAPRTPQTIKQQNALYGGMINEVGIQIRRILETLRASGRLDNTIIVFAADNGLAMGQHGLMGKQSLYNHSVNVPLAIHVPGQEEGVVIDGLCYLSDINPTLYELIGVPKPASVTCPSLAGAMKNGRTERDALLLTYSSIQRAVVWDDMKYIIYNVGGVITRQLFDLKVDPWEKENLIDNSQYAKTAVKYHKRLKKMMAERGDFCDLDNPKWWADGHKITWNEGIDLVK